MINDPGSAPARVDTVQTQPNCLALLAEETVPLTDKGQAKLETSAGLATWAGMNVPVKCICTRRTSAETGFKVNSAGKEQ